MKYKYQGTYQDEKPVVNAGAILILFVLGAGIYLAGGSSIDKSVDSHNVNLCESAQLSGNAEYLSKCADYYATGDIKTMRGN